MKKLAMPVLLPAILLLGTTACSGTSQIEEPTTTAACAEVFSELATYPDLTPEALEREALQKCSSAADWVDTGIRNPGALGFTQVSKDQAETFVAMACLNLDPELTTPVCSDADEQGLLA